LIDAHVHLFLHPGAEDLQTVQESVSQRTILAVLAARADLRAGFTAERDMGTEGAGSADTAVRDAIDEGLIPGPRLRISSNAVDILGGHEDAIHYNPAQHILSNATYANNTAELVTVIRQQIANRLRKGQISSRSTRPGQTRYVMAGSPRPTSTPKQNSALRCRRRRVLASELPFMLLVSRARFTPRKPALPPSIMPISSAPRPCS